ncbi:DUF3592 domain-containing protein [Chthoniobacter flavus]|nr:DUF3592 domain-containing protein [Chthoniobacter flavus]
MTRPVPGPRTLARFESLKLHFLGLIVLAVIVWNLPGPILYFGARQMMSRTDLWMPDGWNEPQVLRAFEEAQRVVQVDATLTTNAHGFHPERRDHLTVLAPTKGEAIAGRNAIVAAMRAVFQKEHAGFLNSSREGPYADPVPNATTDALGKACRWLALALVLVAVGDLVLQWRRSHLPVLALVGILATLLTGIAFVFNVLWVFFFAVGLPAGFLALIVYLTLRVRKAAGWEEGRARITRAKVQVDHAHFDKTRAINKAAIAYEFTVDGKTIQGDRISIGLAPAERVDQTLKRYRVGAEVSVYYDPENPRDCVLERDPPVSFGCLWGGTIAVLLLYAVGWIWMKTGWSPGPFLTRAFPALHHPVVVVGAGSFGLFCVAAGIWNRLHPRTVAAWVRTSGTIVTSETETYTDSGASTSRSGRKMYNAVIEFSYHVDGQEYRGTKGATDLVRVTVGNAQAKSEEEVARYPVGMTVDVYYDPGNPTSASLQPREEIMLTGNHTLIVGAILILVALYAATH